MWDAYLFQVTTGKLGPRIAYESLSWSIELNGIESISLNLSKSDLPAADLNYWLSPWWAGVVLFWNNTPIVAGPITTRPFETHKSVSVNCGGIRSVLAKRIVAENHTDGKALAHSKKYWNNESLGSIAQKVVEACQMKPGGALPITYPMLADSKNQQGNHERTYEGFNVQNLSGDDVLTKLSNVLYGPDIMFKPRMIRDGQLTFEMYYGTEAQPRIKQEFTPVWDTTPERGQVADMSFIYTGTYQTSRVYSIGAGQDQGVVITIDTDERPAQNGYPLLETVINRGSSENEVVVRGHGQADLAANSKGLLEIQMTVRGDGVPGFGQFWPGDLVKVYTKGYLSLPDGMTDMRLLSMTGDGTANVRLSLQRDDKFEVIVDE